MYIPELCLKSLLVSAGLRAGFDGSQVPVEDHGQSLAKYEFTGPGAYRIISVSSSLAVSVSPSDASAIVSASVADNDFLQRWVVADIGLGPKKYTILNYGTGAVYTSTSGIETTVSNSTPPYDTSGHWSLEAGSTEGKPVIITSIGRKDRVLDLFGSNLEAGTKIITWPLKNPLSPNQQWYFERL